MLICPTCKTELAPGNESVSCPKCGASYPIRDGIFIFEKSVETEAYPEECFETGHQNIKSLFWFKKRNKAILNLFRRFINPKSRIVELGCASGLVQEMLEENGYSVEGGDIYLTALNLIRKRSSANHYLIDIKKLPFREEFDAVGMFDVLEHIDDDALALSNVRAALKPGGILVLTVPAGKKLWSRFDEILCHRRRYELAGLRKLLEENGFEILKISYLFYFLYPFILFNRMFMQKKADSCKDDKARFNREINLHPVLNALFGFISDIELLLFRFVNLPAGSSLIAAARKK